MSDIPSTPGQDPAQQEERPQDKPEQIQESVNPNQNEAASEAPQENTPDVPQQQDSAQVQIQQETAPPEPKEPPAKIVVRYGLMKHIGEFRHKLKEPPAQGTKVVVRTERGVELGEVLSNVCQSKCTGCISQERLDNFVHDCGQEYPFSRGGKVLRLANHQDIVDQRHLDSSAHEESTFCTKQIKELGLDMKIVSAEHLLGGERIIFHFTSGGRVDFRELVKRLAGQYRTRIEMRQIGARDEARLVADYEKCGQRCCCQQYLKELKPVSMRMAKVQKATLDPSKISGRCGRLMCCLRYEDVCYEELRKKLPKRNTWVRTPEYIGKVMDSQIITQLVRLILPDNTKVAVANEDILERDVNPPAEGEPFKFQVAKPEFEPLFKTPIGVSDEEIETGKKAASSPEAPQDQKPKRKRRRRRRGNKGQAAQGQPQGGQKQAPQGQQPSQQGKQGQQGQKKSSRRRRRRPRKNKPDSQNS